MVMLVLFLRHAASCITFEGVGDLQVALFRDSRLV